MKQRLQMGATVAACWLIGLSLALFLAGPWLAGLMFIASWPFALLAMLVAVALSAQIATHPVAWSLAATAVGIGSGVVLAGYAGGVFAALIAIPAAVTFVVFRNGLLPLHAVSTTKP